MKKICALLLALSATLTITACDKAENIDPQKTIVAGTEPIQIPEDYLHLSLDGLAEELDKNSLRVTEKYQYQWASIVSYINGISSRDYFTLYSDYYNIYIKCNVKNDELVDVLMQLNEGDEIVVIGIVQNLHSYSAAWDVEIEIDVYAIEVLNMK